MPGLRSLRNRLAVIFALIVASAIGFMYLSFLPRLQGSLTDQKLGDLTLQTSRYADRVRDLADAPASKDKRRVVGQKVRAYATRESAEVLVMGVWNGPPGGTYAIADSAPDGGVRVADVQRLAGRAARTRQVATGTNSTPDGSHAVAARPIVEDRRVKYVLVFADSLSDVQGNVSLMRRQVLISGGLALLAAVLLGYVVASRLASRVNRLEQAARRVAGGDFSSRIEADSDDELGQLANTFDEMQEQLARLDRARKQFIASASHELRTPIFSLGGFLELLADEELSEAERRQFLDQLRGQVERMRRLATELLDLSRLEAGAVELRPEPTDVGELAREVLAEFTPAATTREADVRLAVRPDTLELECDPARVAQVLRILMDNALTHTPPGTGIRVSARRRNGNVRLDVNDHGPGILAENMPHIFEPFFTSGDTAQGAGLGLAIARELADRMNGRLSVRSRPGDTTFSLELPA